MDKGSIKSSLLYCALINPYGRGEKGREIYNFLENSLRKHRLGLFPKSKNIREIYLKSYQEGSSPIRFGRHLLTELAKKAFNIKRDEVKDSDMEKEREYYDPILKDLESIYISDMKEAVEELQEIAQASQDYVRLKNEVKGDKILLFRNVPENNKWEEGYLRANKAKEEIKYYPNILASYTNLESVKDDYGDGRSGLTIRREVPIDEIMIHYSYLLNEKENTDLSDEEEIIVFHKEIEVTLIKPNEDVIENNGE